MELLSTTTSGGHEPVYAHRPLRIAITIPIEIATSLSMVDFISIKFLISGWAGEVSHSNMVRNVNNIPEIGSRYGGG